MNRRLFQSILKLQRINGVRQCVNFQTPSRNYAIELRSTAARGHVRLCGCSGYLQNNEVVDNIITHKSDTRRFSARLESAPENQLSKMETTLLRLETSLQQNGFFHYSHLEQLVDMLESQTETEHEFLTPETVDVLLGGCGSLLPSQQPADRTKLLTRLWDYLFQHKLLSRQSYLTYLQVLKQNRAPLPNLREFLQQYTKFGTDELKMQEMYAALLDTACCSGNIPEAKVVLAEMRDKNYTITERNFNSLITGHALNKDLESCNSVVESMLAAGLNPSTETQTVLIAAYLENNSSEKAAEILKNFHNRFEAPQILKMLQSIRYADVERDLVAQLVMELPLDYVSAPEVPVALRNICIELLHCGKLEQVKVIILTMPEPVFNQNQDTDTFGVFLLKELFRAKVDSDTIIEIAHILSETRKNTRALHIVTEIALRLNPPSALPFLTELATQEPLRVHYFWPMLLYNFRNSGERGIFDTLKCMVALGVECDHATFVQYVLPRLSITLESPTQALKLFDDVGVKTSLVLTPIVGHLLLQNKIDEVCALLDVYPTKVDVSKLLQPLRSLAVNARATKRYQKFAKMLAALTSKAENQTTDYVGQLLSDILTKQSRLKDDFSAVRRLISEMHRCNLRLTPAATDGILSALSPTASDGQLMELGNLLKKMYNRSLTLPQESGAGNGSALLKHPREMSREELEYHLIELEAKNFNTRGVLRRLLQLCVRDGQLERAIEMKAKCDEARVHYSPGMLASILDLYIKLEDLPNAERTLRELTGKFPGFQLDEHKVIDYATLLVHKNQLEAAKQLLQQHAEAHKVIGGDYVMKNIWNYLTQVAQWAASTTGLPKEQNVTREAFEFLRDLRYCSVNNVLLGPLVREYLLRKDIHNAVKEFCRLCEQYRHTPLQLELMALLVRVGNANALDMEQFSVSTDEAQGLLENVTAAGAKVHGVVNMNSTLLMAFAQSGTDSQLRRLLINPEVRLNQEVLQRNCQHLLQEGALPTLLRLARCSRGLSRVIDEQSIYNMILNHFVTTNDTKGALSLYDSLEADDDLKISQQFLQNLVNLLKVNNMDVPTNVALRAQVG